MRITLIEPKPPGKHVFSTVKMPRLGLPILATMLRAQGHDVHLVYGVQKEIRYSDIDGRDLVGISATTSTAPAAYALADLAREMGITVVMGGPHVTFLPEEALSHCDFVVRGEGDYSFPCLVERLSERKDPDDIPGISFLRNGHVVHNPGGEWVSVDKVPFPDIRVFGKKGLSTYPVMTSRGCPFDCTFCSVTQMFGHKFRYRANEDVIAELRQYRGKQVFFVDDNFTANKARAKDLMQTMIDEKIGLKRWFAQVRTDAARDDELLRLMKASGCGYVYVGMESVNPETLKDYNKKQDVEDIRYCVERFHDHGIMVHGMFVFGSDADTAGTIRETVRFALENRIDTIQFMILTPLPGTKTFDQLKSEGRIFTFDWGFYDAHHAVFRPVKMSARELQIETIKAFRQFYSVRNMFINLKDTGWRSVAFKAVGHWIVRKWEKENGWYYGFLEDPEKCPRGERVESVAPLSRDLYLDLKAEGETAVAMLKGFINKEQLKKVAGSLMAMANKDYARLVIDLAQASFPSENVLGELMRKLARLPHRAREVTVRLPFGKEQFAEFMRKYDLTITEVNFLLAQR